ncbi:MAG: hypothetical protein ACR2PG_26970 [Hyphomicrobiaceae bacterium]
MSPVILKFIVLLVLILAGAICVWAGRGGALPFVKYKGLETANVPIGIAMIGLAVALAVFWKVGTTTKETTRGADGSITIREIRVESGKVGKAAPPTPEPDSVAK